MTAKRPASPDLEAFVDEGLTLAFARGHHPTSFVGMRHQLGTIGAIERLVETGDVQSGFKRLQALGLIDWSMEAAVLKFSDQFTAAARQCAEWRLKQVASGKKSGARAGGAPAAESGDAPPTGPTDKGH